MQRAWSLHIVACEGDYVADKAQSFPALLKGLGVARCESKPECERWVYGWCSTVGALHAGIEVKGERNFEYIDELAPARKDAFDFVEQLAADPDQVASGVSRTLDLSEFLYDVRERIGHCLGVPRLEGIHEGLLMSVHLWH